MTAWTIIVWNTKSVHLPQNGLHFNKNSIFNNQMKIQKVEVLLWKSKNAYKLMFEIEMKIYFLVLKMT